MKRRKNLSNYLKSHKCIHNMHHVHKFWKTWKISFLTIYNRQHKKSLPNAAPHFDKQYEDGVRSTLLPLKHLGNCKPSHHLKDSVIQGGRPSSNVMLLCILYATMFRMVYAIMQARIWSSLFLPGMRLCDMFAWHCWHTQWNESPIHHLPQVTDCVF